MIGHYLLTLTREQEGRLLTQRFGGRTEPCLCMLVGAGAWGVAGANFTAHRAVPGEIYEMLIGRFSVSRVNAAIRSRILSNCTRRALQTTPVLNQEEPR